MLCQLRRLVGEPGPLVIETQHGLISEPCVVIKEEHIQRVAKQVGDTHDIYLEQTSDRSFIIRKTR